MADPRTDQHPGDGVPGSYPTPAGEPQQAPGGVGTGTKDAPEKEPAAQPDKK